MKMKGKFQMSKSKKQCINIINKRNDNLKNEKDTKALFIVLEETIKDISSSEFGLLWLFDEDKNRLKTFIKNREIELILETSILKSVSVSKRGFFDNYVVSHQKYNQKVDNPLNIKIKSMIIVPILDKRKEKVFGFISAYNSVKHTEELKRYDLRSLGLLESCAFDAIQILNDDTFLTPLPTKDIKETLPPKKIEIVKKITTTRRTSGKIKKKPIKIEKKETTSSGKSKLDLERELKVQKEKIRALENELLLKTESIKNKEAEIEKYSLTVLDTEVEEDILPVHSELNTVLAFLTNEVTYLSNEDHKVYLFLEIIKNSLHNKEQLHFLNYTLDNSGLIEKLANDLYIREKMPLLFEEFNVYQLINDIGHLYGKTLADKNITFNIFINPYTPHLLVSDKDKIKSLIIHLMNNIFNFTNESGAIELNVKFLEESSELNIEIKGLKHYEIKKMKSFFAQKEVSHSLTSSDSGLGLSVSSNLINILGGKLKLFTSKNNEHSFMALIPIQIMEKSDEHEKKIFLFNKILKVAILMGEENLYASQSLVRQLQALGIKEKSILTFRNSKKMNNTKFSHVFCFENMLFSDFKFKNVSSLTILKHSNMSLNLKKIESKHCVVNELYVNNYYGLELQKILFPDMDVIEMKENTLVVEDSFLSKFNNVVKKLKFS